MKIVQTPSGDIVAVLSPWELQIVATGVDGFRAGLGAESPTTSAMALLLEEAVKLTPADPCICGDMHPIDDCGSPAGA